MNEAMKQEIEAAEQKSILDITKKMLTACDNRKIDHCVSAALSVIGNIMAQQPKLAAPVADSLHKLADHIAASAETKHDAPQITAAMTTIVAFDATKH